MELTTGIKESVEDIGAIFKRMAILHPDRPVAPTPQPVTPVAEPTLFSLAALPDPQPATQLADPADVFVYAVAVKRRKKQVAHEPDENQLSLFDLPLSA